MNPERLFRWSALLWSALGLLFVAVEPAVLLQGFGNHRVPVVIHTLTLGAFVNGYYALQWRAWRRLYGYEPPWPRFAVLIWAIHQSGVAIMLTGFLVAGLRVALLGAHYIVPLGIALHAVQAVLATRRRVAGTPRHLGAHTPTLGLIIVMALGAMIILDETTGRYGMFNPPTLLVHGMAGAFLFLFPALRLAEGLANQPAADSHAAQRLTSSVLLRTVPLAVGILILVTGLHSGGGFGIAAGLALVGVALVWSALPNGAAIRSNPAAVFRSAWLAPGLVLMFSAIRFLRGIAPVEAFTLANVGAVSVLLVAGLPELWLRLSARNWPNDRADLPAALGASLLIAAGAIALAGQLASAALAVQAAAGVGLMGWLVLVLKTIRRAH